MLLKSMEFVSAKQDTMPLLQVHSACLALMLTLSAYGARMKLTHPWSTTSLARPATWGTILRDQPALPAAQFTPTV